MVLEKGIGYGIKIEGKYSTCKGVLERRWRVEKWEKYFNSIQGYVTAMFSELSLKSISYYN